MTTILIPDVAYNREWKACEACATFLLTRAHNLAGSPCDSAPCQLHYEGICQDGEGERS